MSILSSMTRGKRNPSGFSSDSGFLVRQGPLCRPQPALGAASEHRHSRPGVSQAGRGNLSTTLLGEGTVEAWTPSKPRLQHHHVGPEFPGFTLCPLT